MVLDSGEKNGLVRQSETTEDVVIDSKTFFRLHVSGRHWAGKSQ